VYGVPEIRLGLIKYLNAHYGITDVFMEIGFAEASLYNAYLATGDTAYLVQPLLIYYSKAQGRKFWRQLYLYNKGLERKIRIRGMDFERIGFLKVLKLLTPHGVQPSRGIATVLQYIDTATVGELAQLHTALFEAQNAIYNYIRTDMENNKSLYKKYYGANYHIIKDIMFNENTYDAFKDRDRTMYRNIMKQVEEDSISKFIVFCGMNHGDKTNANSGTLCYRLASNPAIKNKLVDMAMICRHCFDYQLKPGSRNAAYRGPSVYSRDTSMAHSIYTKHSRKDCQYTLIPSVLTGSHTAEEFSDYIILLKDQPEF
jgi:hypothetical protein